MSKAIGKSTEAGSANVNIDLQLNLLNTWTKFKVADYYQNIFLAYLDQLGSHQAEELIKKQISLTLQRRSGFFQLQKVDRERKTILQKLKVQMQQTESTIASQQLQQIFQNLKQLRQTNLMAAEQILKMYNGYHCSSLQSAEKQLECYDTMLDNLDRDNNFLKESQFASYFVFDQGYDPFFMGQYEIISRNKAENISELIKDFYNISISYAYRLMKTKNMILQLRALTNPNHLQYEKSKSFVFADQMKGKDSIHYKKKASLRHQKYFQGINIDEGENTQRIRFRDKDIVKIHPIQIYPSTHARSRTTIYRQKQDGTESQFQMRVRDRLKLKFQKVDSRPATNSNSLLHDAHNQQAYRKNRRIQLHTQAYQPKRQLYRITPFQAKKRNSIPQIAGKVPSPKTKPLKYKASVGQIYRSIKLNPIIQRKTDIQNDTNAKKFPQIGSDKRMEKEARQIQKGPQIQNDSAKYYKSAQQKQPTDRAIQPDNPKTKELVDYKPVFKIIKNYNPIKREQFGLFDGKQQKNNRYDFDPRKIMENGFGSQKIYGHRSISPEQLEADNTGLPYQQPISKYNLKRNKKLAKVAVEEKVNSRDNSNQKLSVQQQTDQIKNTKIKEIPKIDQQSQTIELRKTEKKVQPIQIKKEPTPRPVINRNIEQPEQQPVRVIQSKKEPTPRPAITRKIEQPQKQPERVPARRPINNNPDSDQTLEDQDIVDERPPKASIHKKDLIRPVNKEKQPEIATKNQPQKIEPSPRKIDQTLPGKANQIEASNNKKKQIRMKVGKSSYEQFSALLKYLNIKEQYKRCFDIQKLLIWMKVSQTYLTQFYIDEEVAIVALSSPIPNVGMALKLWAPVSKQVDENVSANLFKKYIQFVEKSVTSQKIMYSGTSFKELELNEFTMKKQNLFERIRKNPAKESNHEFKPFLYVQCSNVKFESKGNTKVFYSEQIQEFSSQNSYAATFMSQANNNYVPAPLRPLIHFTEGVASFKKVNEILSLQNFDNYEASQIQISNIDLMRFYLHSAIKSTFIASDSSFKFTGTLIHQKDRQCVVCLGTTKNNGNIYFCKNLKFNNILQTIKKQSTTKVAFSVRMFSKKLYGKMTDAGGGYGNWQINLTWEDEFQGRIRHELKEAVSFGPEPFRVMLEFQKTIVFGFEVKDQDFIS